jgi:hypothetical protein
MKQRHVIPAMARLGREAWDPFLNELNRLGSCEPLNGSRIAAVCRAEAAFAAKADGGVRDDAVW